MPVLGGLGGVGVGEPRSPSHAPRPGLVQTSEYKSWVPKLGATCSTTSSGWWVKSRPRLVVLLLLLLEPAGAAARRERRTRVVGAGGAARFMLDAVREGLMFRPVVCMGGFVLEVRSKFGRVGEELGLLRKDRACLFQARCMSKDAHTVLISLVAKVQGMPTHARAKNKRNAPPGPCWSARGALGPTEPHHGPPPLPPS